MYYSEMTDAELLLLMDAHPNGLLRCEYRHAQYDNGAGEGKMIPCRNTATMWTDRGLRCEDHKGD